MASLTFTRAAHAYRVIKIGFDAVKLAEYDNAESATRGAMVNAVGRRAGITGWELMNRNMATVRKYGSAELIEYLDTYPKTTLESFERQAMDYDHEN